jgi:hypothetical protein
MPGDALQRLLDREAIADLVHEYCVRVDRYEPERVAELFFEDCRVDYGPSLGGAETGREPLARKLRLGLGQFEGTHHQVSNLQIRFESENRATAISYVTAWHGVPGDGADLTVFGQYHDVLERRDGRWGFAERRILVSCDSGSPVRWNRTPRAGRD